MSEAHVTFELLDGVGLLTLRRPRRHNAVTRELLVALGSAIDAAAAEGPALRSLVVTGAGRSFCSGADLADIGPLGVAEARAFMLEAAWSFRRLERLSVPVVAAVRGYCLGGGFELALHCDLVLVDETASFGFPEASIGLSTTTGAVDRLARAVGSMRARALLLTGRRIPAEEAVHMGLALGPFPPAALDDEAMALARGFVSASREGLAATKALLRGRAEAGAPASWVAEAEAFEGLFAAFAAARAGGR